MSARSGNRFIDEVRITASSGDGGHGARTFRREKFVPLGGPSGGDGGKGGDVVFVAVPGLNTLHKLRFRPIVKAKRGGHGDRMNRHGKTGEDAVIEVPVGTLIKDGRSGRLIVDMAEAGQREVVLRGGRGGRGNCRFVTPQLRAPDFAEDGLPGETRELQLELKLLADIGLLGFPNAGKSTLISRLSAAKPKVAAYPFTTLEPSLGVVEVPGTWGGETFVVADIPGLIEGAAEGAGLGHQFLRHVERCRLLLHLVSLDPWEPAGDPMVRFDAINTELKRYDPQLAERPQVVLLSKCDLAPPESVEELRAAFEARGLPVHVASASTGEGIRELIFALAEARKAAGES